jgi:hypothetical protein
VGNAEVREGRVRVNPGKGIEDEVTHPTQVRELPVSPVAFDCQGLPCKKEGVGMTTELEEAVRLERERARIEDQSHRAQMPAKSGHAGMAVHPCPWRSGGAPLEEPIREEVVASVQLQCLHL